MEDLHYYIIPSLLKEKPDTVVIHIGSNNITHRILTQTNWQMRQLILVRCVGNM